MSEAVFRIFFTEKFMARYLRDAEHPANAFPRGAWERDEKSRFWDGGFLISQERHRQAKARVGFHPTIRLAGHDREMEGNPAFPFREKKRSQT